MFFVLSLLIVSSELLFSSGRMPYHRDDTILFCLNPDQDLLTITKFDNGISVDNDELNKYFIDNGIIDLESWSPAAGPNDFRGDVYLNRIYRAYVSENSKSEIDNIKDGVTHLSCVLSSEFENIHKPIYSPNDPRLNEQCSIESVKADFAWDYWVDAGLIPGDQQVLLASVDTAVDFTHPDLEHTNWINQNEIPVSIFSIVDSDGNGYVTATEVIEFLEDESLDLNEDGTINLEDAIHEDSPFIDGVDDDDWDSNPSSYRDDLIGWDCSGYSGADDNNPYPKLGVPNNGTWAHGTHVAGILGATSNNNIGIASTAFNCSVMPVKCSRENQSGDPMVSDGYNGILYAAKAGYSQGTFTIINCSWGGGGYSGYEQNQIDIAHDDYGAVIVAAAGNGDDYSWQEEYSAHYPSSYDGVISVCAMGCSGTWGHWATYHETVDLAAPGEGILSAIIGVGYESWDGSSMASPNAASCIGLLKAFFPEMTNTQLEEKITESADDFVYDLNPGYDTCDGADGNHPGTDCFGSGMVDVFKAIGGDIFPNLSYFSHSFILNGGDGDGVLNPGEPAELRVILSNEAGWVNAENVTATLSCNHTDVTITDDSAIYPNTITAGGTGVNISDTFAFELSEDISLGAVEFSLLVQSDASDDLTYYKTIDFEIAVELYQDGWPISLDNQVVSSPAVFDVNADGENEIIFGDYNGLVHAFGVNGQEISGFPFETGSQIWGSPAIADLEDDGDFEIIIGSKDKHLYILNSDGSVQVDYDSEQYLMGSPSVGNLDDDSDLEVVFGGYSSPGKLFAINADGSDVIGFPYEVGEKIQRGITLADINGNGKMEMIFGTDSENIHLIYDNLTEATGFPYEAGNDFRTAPSVLTIGGEVIIFAGSRDDNFYAINIDGSLRFMIETGDDVSTSAGFVEIDNEIAVFFGSEDGFIYAVDANGQSIDGWPIEIGDQIVSSPVFADFDNDGTTEVVTATDMGDILVFRIDGTPFNYSPINYSFPLSSSPCIHDIDSDGDLEILVGSTGSMVIIDIKDTGNNTGYWNMHRGNILRTGFFTDGSVSIGDNKLSILSYKLEKAYPNPFNPVTTIEFTIPSFDTHSNVSLLVYNVNGQLIETLVNRQLEAGYHSVTWDAETHPSGIYFINFIVDGITQQTFKQTQKLLLIK